MSDPTYSISDGNGGTATASVTVTVYPVNDPPVVGVDIATQTHQYSDAIDKITITAEDVDDSSLTLELKYTVDGDTAAIADLPGALLSTQATCTPTGEGEGEKGTICQWEISGFIGVPEGDYDIQAIVIDAGSLTATSLDFHGHRFA